MTPSDPGSILTDTIQQSKDRLSTAAWWALVIVMGLGVVALGSRRRR